MDETGTGSDETGTGNDETGTGNDETDTGNDETNTGNDDTDNVSNVRSTENNDTKEEIDEADDGNKEPPRDQEEIRENEIKISEETPKMEEIVHIRRSERVRKQRYNIHPDDIGNDDDKTDQDYIQKDEKQNWRVKDSNQ